MATATTFDAAVHAAKARTELQHKLAAAAAQQSKDRVAAHRRMQGDTNRRARQHRRARRIRVMLAREGIKSICTLALLPEIQELITVSGGSITLWGKSYGGSPGGDMGNVFYEYGASIVLTSTSVEVAYVTKVNGDIDVQDSVSLSFRYADANTRSKYRPLDQIATVLPIDWEFLEHQMERDETIIIDPDVLFEILVECAKPEQLERYFLTAIGSSAFRSAA